MLGATFVGRSFSGDKKQLLTLLKAALDANVLALATWWLVRNTPRVVEAAPPGPARHEPDYLMQGVTTVITGNDGGGPADVAEHLARYDAFWNEYYLLTQRKGVSQQYARIEMRRRNTLIGAMLLRSDEVDGMLCGTWGTTAQHLAYIDQVIGRRLGGSPPQHAGADEQRVRRETDRQYAAPGVAPCKPYPSSSSICQSGMVQSWRIGQGPGRPCHD